MSIPEFFFLLRQTTTFLNLDQNSIFIRGSVAFIMAEVVIPVNLSSGSMEKVMEIHMAGRFASLTHQFHRS